MRIKSKLFLIGLVCLVLKSKAQDTYLSQYYASPLSFNPASVGLHNGIFRATADIRQQFGDFAGSTSSFKNFIGSFDLPIKFVSLGGVLKAQTEGLFTSLSLNGAIGYEFKLDKNKYNRLSIGIMGGVSQTSFNVDKAQFQNPESVDNSNIINPDLHAGFMYYNSNIKARFSPFFGGSVYRIIEHRSSNFINDPGNQPLNTRKYNGFGGVQVNINKKVDVIPHIISTYYAGALNINPGVFGQYFLRDDDASLMLGVQMKYLQTFSKQSTSELSAVVPQIGIQYRDLMFGFSYDFNTSQLSNAINGGNDGFEFSIIYIKRKNIKLREDNICPRL